MSKRIIAFLVVFSSLLSFAIIPVFASDDDYSSLDTVGFWEAMLHDGIIGGITDGLDIFLGTSFAETNFVNKVSSALTSSYCDKSDDGWHHCQGKDLYLSGNDVMGKCSLCGKAFDVTDDAVNQLMEAYGTSATDDIEATGFVGSLPASIVDSEGKYYWRPWFKYGFIYYGSSVGNTFINYFGDYSDAVLWVVIHCLQILYIFLLPQIK